MAKLNSSLILPSFVHGVRHLSSFNSSLSSSVKGIPKRHDSFDNVDDALAFFNKMIQKYPKPSIVEFNKLLAPIVRMKHYAVVVSKYTQLELFGFFEHLG
ncbi:hypothetical protein V6N12_010727 [Hibiscus sabdariffa]|uniref:Pentatricopeptide repeat-containing protein n=1 Tax=Hibiscus sabdariffa TaxID=183260 RepID=A0ABR2EMN8_9ROSI